MVWDSCRRNHEDFGKMKRRFMSSSSRKSERDCPKIFASPRHVTSWVIGNKSHTRFAGRVVNTAIFVTSQISLPDRINTPRTHAPRGYALLRDAPALRTESLAVAHCFH